MVSKVNDVLVSKESISNVEPFYIEVIWKKKRILKLETEKLLHSRNNSTNLSLCFHVYSERVHKRRFKDTVKDFSLMCRGLYGTPYACG